MIGALGVTFSTITVQWGPVECRHTNGDITGYSVRYGEVGSGREEVMVVSGEATQTDVTGLTPGRLYSVRVAAVNSAGEGSYSQSIEGRSHLLALGFNMCVYNV